MHAVEDHRGGLVRIAPDDRSSEWDKRDQVELQDIEKERRSVDPREVAEIDRIADPVRAQYRERKREAEETWRERGQPCNKLGRRSRIRHVQLEDEKRHRDRIDAIGERVQSIHVIATSPRS